MQIESQIAQREHTDALANDLAIEAMRSLNSGLTVPSALNVDDPESVRSFEKFKSVLMAAYARGALDAQTGRVVCAVSDISALKGLYQESGDVLLGNPNIHLFTPA